MKNLFNIDQTLFALHQEIEDNAGEMTPEMELLLEITDEERAQKCEGYVYVIRQLKAKSESIKAEAKRLMEYVKHYEKTIEKLENNLLDSIITNGSVKTDFVSISSRKSKSVSITDESLLEADFWRIKAEPNKTAIKEAIEAGQEVAGALIVENYSLNIR